MMRSVAVLLLVGVAGCSVGVPFPRTIPQAVVSNGEEPSVETRLRVLEALLADTRTIEQYGYAMTDPADWQPAFQAFFDDPAKPRRLLLGVGQYRIKRTVVVCRSAEIAGQGRQTEVLGWTGHTGVHLPFFSDPACGDQWSEGGRESWLHDFVLKGSHTPIAGTQTYGILMETRAKMTDVFVTGRWTHGIKIDGGAKREQRTNAAVWRLDGVQCAYSGHACIFVDGPDASVGLGMQTATTHSCMDAALYPDLPPCAGTVLSDFLGSTLLGALSHASNGFPGQRMHDPKNGNQRGLCLGCYKEGDQPNSVMGRTSVAIGGHSFWNGGLWIGNGQIAGQPVLTAPFMRPLGTDTTKNRILLRIETSPGRYDACIELLPNGSIRGSTKCANNQERWRWRLYE